MQPHTLAKAAEVFVIGVVSVRLPELLEGDVMDLDKSGDFILSA